MKTKVKVLTVAALIVAIAAIVMIDWWQDAASPSAATVKNTVVYDKKKSREERAFFVKERIRHEFNMLKDPATGLIPAGIREQELKVAKSLPARYYGGAGGNTLGADNLNSYTPAGPNNVGGRTRAVAFDKRFNNSSNRVILSGSISGGIFRSADGGANWTRVNPENDIHNLSALAQDPRPGFENTWYAGGGEPIANSASGAGAFYFGFGVWKSTDNGVTWIKLTKLVTDINGTTVLGDGVLETFDNPFDIVHKIIVSPVNGDVYVAAHRRLVRSTNGGTSWNVVFTGTAAACTDNGQLDLVCTTTGKLYLAVNGGNPDGPTRGVWTSTTGNANSWTRLAGGTSLGVDSVAGWRANSYIADPSGCIFLSRRIVMALAPSNENILYVTYENGDDHSGAAGKTEADLYKFDNGTSTWTNLSANMPNFTDGGTQNLDGVDPFLTQGGYDLMIAVKPDDANAVFLGGVNLFRSTSGFTNTTATSWIGGYGRNFSTLNIYGSIANPNDITKWTHPDMHALAFDPSNPSRAISANDGGIHITENIMATLTASEPVLWTVLPNYQTLQYYHVAIDPGSGRNNFAGGAQDNGTRFRDATGVLAPATFDNQYRIVGGDGGSASIAKVVGSSQNVFCATQFGNIIRATLATGSITGGSVRPNGLTATPGLTGAFGDFVTYFKIDFDNSEDLYYVNFNRLFRTKNSSTVSSSLGWEELTGVSSAVNPGSPTSGTNISITALEMSRGDYFPSHVLYIGTSNGKIFRLSNPRNALASTSPFSPTPLQLSGFVSDIAVNPNNDDEIMVVASNYGTNSIFWTNNAKSNDPTWYLAEGNLSLPSIRSCAIVVKKDASNNPVTEYYVGTSVGLYSAVNIGPILQGAGSVNWVREGGNVLNFAVITALDYRPQDNVLLVGTHGNGMYYAQTGTPDFRPNQNTGVDDPVRNDRNFILNAYPTITKNTIRYQTGNMFTVKRISIQVHSLSGQLVMRRETGYESGEIDVRKFSKGAYVLTITSQDYKQQFVRKFVKE